MGLSTQPVPFHLFDPCLLFEKFLRGLNLGSLYRLPEKLKVILPMPLEYQVQLTGSLQGILILDCSSEFPKLMLNRDGAGLHWGNEDESLLIELLSLLSLYLFHAIWKPDDFEIGPIEPKLSDHSHWPNGAPRYTCAFSVGGSPLILRLWLKSP